MKLQRSGYTEGNLVFCNYLQNIIKIDDNDKFNNINNQFINYLYSTSGFYDRKIKGSFFDFNYKEILDSHIYQQFIKEYQLALTNCDHLIILHHTSLFDPYNNYINNFRQYLNSSYVNIYGEYWCNHKNIYSLLEGKRLLIVSSFSDLICEQVNNKNIFSIYADFPAIESIAGYTYPYCYFNNGPDASAFETIDRVVDSIISIDFDVAIVSAGFAGAIIVDRINSMGKTAMTIGATITLMFGINQCLDHSTPYWITKIPDKYKPKKYKKIEGGGYWDCIN